jgi:hypothetical protein
MKTVTTYKIYRNNIEVTVCNLNTFNTLARANKAAYIAAMEEDGVIEVRKVVA